MKLKKILWTCPRCGEKNYYRIIEDEIYAQLYGTSKCRICKLGRFSQEYNQYPQLYKKEGV